jgi:hypothetical protein
MAQNLKRGAAALIGLVTALVSACPSQGQITSPFGITAVVVNKNGTTSVQWKGADRDIIIQFTADLKQPHWQTVPGVEWPITGTNWTGFIPMSPGKGFLRVISTGGRGTTPVPFKTISLALIGWHDPQSDRFFRNCTACHGTRTMEVALDGRTPTAHSIMLDFYGQGNDRCINCHYNGPNYTGPDFLTGSAGALRKQVNYEVNGCTACHAKGSFIPLYDRY